MLALINLHGITLDWPAVSRILLVLILIVFTRLSARNCQVYSEGFEPLIQVQNLEGINVSDFDCPTWHFYNKNNGKCECYKFSDVEKLIKCKDNGATALQYGQCMTHDRNTGITIVSVCPYFQATGYNILEDLVGYITLPSNISELNDYMCGPMHRKGPLCSECIGNFGLSATSFRYTCSNCTQFSLTYGIPLYVLIEVIPITVLYLIILIFRINLTSSPMTCFILYSHLVMNTIIINLSYPVDQIFYQPNHFRTVVIALYGMWNLDFFKYILPPFCLSSHLKQTHVALFGYISVVYPLCLMIITLVCIELHGHNFRPIVWLWRPLHKVFVKIQKEWNAKSDVIDVFATFLLLSCSKVIYQFVVLIRCPALLKANSNTGDVSLSHVGGNEITSCGGTNHLSFAIPACFIACIVFLLVLLLILYPFKWFRDFCFFSKCGFLNQTSVYIFVEKFHNCYRNGLDGGRDMRSFSGLYFGLRIILGPGFYFILHKFLPPWTFGAILLSSAAMLIALVQPYKKTYMNVLDSLLLSLLAMICLLLSMSSEYSSVQGTEVFIIILIPAVIFWLYLVFKLVYKLWKKLKHCCFVLIMEKTRMFNIDKCSQQSQLLTHPTSSTVTIADVCSYGSMHS